MIKCLIIIDAWCKHEDYKKELLDLYRLPNVVGAVQSRGPQCDPTMTCIHNFDRDTTTKSHPTLHSRTLLQKLIIP